MKSTVVGILLSATLVFGGLYLHEARKAARAQAGADSLQQTVGELKSNLEKQEKRATHLREQLEEARADAAARIQEATQYGEALQAKLAGQAQAATAGATGRTNAKPSNLLAEMFKNPEMKKMLINQQKGVLGTMIDKNYGKLFSDLHLTPEQASTFKDMLLDKQLGAADLGLSMFSGEADATNRTALAEQVKAASDKADAQIKEFLGQDNFAQYQEYEKSMGERMAVSGFQDQLGSGTTALNDDQEQQLIQAMMQERQNFKFTTDLSDKSKFTGDFSTMFNEDKMNTYFQELGQLDQQYLARAQGILSPDQLAAFGKYLDGQQALQKAGMQMAAKMFAPAKP